MEKSYRYVSYFFIGLLTFVFIAFFKTYFGLFPHFNNSITYVTHYHACTLILWFAMLIVQPILIRNKQFEGHRLVGKASYIIVPLMVLGLLMIAHQQQVREKNLAVFTANLVDIPQFVIFYGLAMYYRKNTPYHLRFILLSTLSFIGPAAARIPIDSLSITGSLYLFLLIYERFKTKIYKPYLIGLAISISNLVIMFYLFIVNQPILEKIWGLFWG